MSFHSYRTSLRETRGFLRRLWRFHDRHPLPPRLNRSARLAVHVLRRAHFWTLSRLPAPSFQGREPPVDSLRLASTEHLEPDRDGQCAVAQAEQRFEFLHDLNGQLRTDHGAWVPQPHMKRNGCGIRVEEVALRVLGYMAAYRGTGNSEYLVLARKGCHYLISHRLYADGHMWLQGHTVIDITYAIAGMALLDVYERDQDDGLLNAAKLLGLDARGN